jgi:enterochelin esterase-like enzyme
MVWHGGLQARPRAIRVAPLLLIAALLLGEAPEKLVAVYLPPGYEEEKERTYPVVYYLHGFGFGPTKLARVKPHLDTYFEMRPEDAMIVVAVDGNTEPGGSFWRNSPIIGDWADFAAEEVPEFVEDEYRVADTRRARGLAGFSMGASAAIHLPVSRPDHYGAVFATGPAMPPVEDPRRFMEGIGYPKTASTIAAIAYEAFLTEEGALDRSAYEEAAVTDEVIREAARDLAAVLDDHGVEYRLVEFEGGHAMAAGRFAEVLVPYFARTLES